MTAELDAANAQPKLHRSAAEILANARQKRLSEAPPTVAGMIDDVAEKMRVRRA